MLVHKYTMLRSNLPQSVALPSGAKVVHFAFQFRIPTLWAEISPNQPIVSRVFALVGTGMDIPEGASHFATTIEESTGNVWHLYEIA